jgi:hypothetical protein
MDARFEIKISNNIYCILGTNKYTHKNRDIFYLT